MPISKHHTFLIPPDDPNANYNVTTNTFYLTFWHDGIPGTFILLVAIRWAIALLGFLLNFGLFIVVLKNQSILWGTCNLFIALNALLTALFELSLTISMVMQLTGPQVVTLRTCFLIQIVPIFLRNIIISTLLAIGVDRLIGVMFVIWHLHHSQSTKYRLSLLSVCILHALFFIFFSTGMAIRMPELRIICLSSDDCYQGDGEQVLFLLNTAILILVLLCYLIIWIFLRLRANNAEMETTKRIIKSLTLTTTVISIGWLSYNGIQAFLLPSLDHWLLPVQTVYLTFGSSIFPYVAMALNGPMYFWFSKDYRNAIVKTFKWLPINSSSQSSNQIGPAVNVLLAASKLSPTSSQPTAEGSAATALFKITDNSRHNIRP